MERIIALRKTTIGLDIAKHAFHAHGASADGRVVLSRRITRGKLLEFFASQPSCVVALEACGGAHHWARELRAMGHDVRLIPPAYVKPYVKRGKNDAVDAEAICEAAQRPSMRFVAVKSEEQQAAALVFRTRDLLVRQRTQLGNAIRGHLTEYGWIAPKAISHLGILADLLEDGEMASTLAATARPMFAMMIDMLAELDKRIADDPSCARGADEGPGRHARANPHARCGGPLDLAWQRHGSAPHDRSRRGRHHGARLRGHDRRSRALPPIGERGRLSRAHTEDLCLGRCES